MELEEYRTMFEAEDKHWWYKVLHELLFSEVKKVLGNRLNSTILDAGCGTGFILKNLNK